MSAERHATLCDVARAEIDALAADGIACTPDDVVLLNALGWEIESPAHRQAMSRGTPVQCGRAWLWPMTLASDDWLQRAIDAHPGKLDRQGILLAFAMAHCRTQERLDAIPPADAYPIARKWFAGLSCRLQEVQVAVSLVLAQDASGPAVHDPKAEGGSITPGQMVAILTAAAGGPPELWERQVSIGYIREQFLAIDAQFAAQAGGSLKDSHVVHATRQLGLAAEAIRAREMKKREAAQ